VSGEAEKNGLFVIGLLGGIGSGKSTVARIIEARGGGRIDCDDIVHELYKIESVIESVAREFGDQVRGPDGIDRSTLGKVALASEEAIKRLMSIVHPLVVRAVQGGLSELEKVDARFAVIEAAFLIEAGLDKFCDTIWFIDVDAEECRKRVVSDRGWSEEEIIKRDQYQMTPEEKRAHADAVIENRSDLAALEAQVDKLLDRN